MTASFGLRARAAVRSSCAAARTCASSARAVIFWKSSLSAEDFAQTKSSARVRVEPAHRRRAFQEFHPPLSGRLLWHAKCFLYCRQAWRKLNHDPAAITSLSVACRYASRPPSDPTIYPSFRNLAPKAGFSRFWGLFYFHFDSFGFLKAFRAVARRRHDVNASSHARPFAATPSVNSTKNVT